MSKQAAAKRRTLSIVIPAFNASASIGQTINVAADAAARSCFDVDFVVVDDGSTDGTADAARAAQSRFPIQVLSQPNSGRVPSRRNGLAAAKGEFVLLLDSRVLMAPESLAYACDRIANGEVVWNGHVVIDTAGNPYAKFWKVVTHLAWSEYLANPRTTSFTSSNFDKYPKGTTCFLAPADLLRKSFVQFRSYYADERNASDDTPMIRWIADQQPIHISPDFACSYAARTTLGGFVNHAYHRGIVFLDGHGRRQSRFFPLAVAFYPLSLIAVLVLLRKPAWAVGGLAAGVAAAFGFTLARRFNSGEAVSFATLSPVYAASHGAGMWHGLVLLVANRLRRP